LNSRKERRLGDQQAAGWLTMQCKIHLEPLGSALANAWQLLRANNSNAHLTEFIERFSPAIQRLTDSLCEPDIKRLSSTEGNHFYLIDILKKVKFLLLLKTYKSLIGTECAY
jgi:hypothetical protein